MSSVPKKYRVTVTVTDGKGAIILSFIVRSGAGWEWAIEQAENALRGWTRLSALSVKEE